jgi:hypothetical protein
MRLKLFFLFAILLLSTTSAIAISQTQPSSDSCAIIAFKNGRIIRAKILLLTETEIHFRICEESDKQTYTQEPRNILSILHSDGKTETFETPTKDKNGKEILSDQEQHAKKLAITLGAFALLSAAIGIFIFGVLFGLIALVLGIIGIFIAENTRRKGGETLSAAGALIGLIVFGLTLIRLPK